MKRYTLQFLLANDQLSLNELEAEVEGLLDRLHPRLTYKLGPSFRGDNGLACVQVAVDGKRRLFEEAVKAVVWKQAIRFDRMLWGWTVEGPQTGQAEENTSAIDVDPLESISAFTGNGQFAIKRSQLHRRYILLAAIILIFILVIIANITLPLSPAWAMLYAVCFAGFMFALSETPLDIRLYADRINFELEQLDIKLWLRKRAVAIDYASIWGMDYRDAVCTIFHGGKKTRLLLHERFGCQARPLILKSIVERAGLSFVEGNFRKLEYRRPDALT